MRYDISTIRKEDRHGKRTKTETRQSESATASSIEAKRIGWTALWLILGAVLFLNGCSWMTVAPKPVPAHAIAFDRNTANAGIIDCDHAGCLVTSSFVAKYHQMEAEFRKTFADDQYIKRDGDNYRMPYSCVENFTRLKAMERGG